MLMIEVSVLPRVIRGRLASAFSDAGAARGEGLDQSGAADAEPGNLRTLPAMMEPPAQRP
jgi:hypothetical protein